MPTNEAAQKRVLDVFRNWEIPESITFINSSSASASSAGTPSWKRTIWPRSLGLGRHGIPDVEDRFEAKLEDREGRTAAF